MLRPLQYDPDVWQKTVETQCISPALDLWEKFKLSVHPYSLFSSSCIIQPEPGIFEFESNEWPSTLMLSNCQDACNGRKTINPKSVRSDALVPVLAMTPALLWQRLSSQDVEQSSRTPVLKQRLLVRFRRDMENGPSFEGQSIIRTLHTAWDEARRTLEASGSRSVS